MPENRMVTSFGPVFTGIGLTLKFGWNHDEYLLSGILSCLVWLVSSLDWLLSSTVLSSTVLSRIPVLLTATANG